MAYTKTIWNNDTTPAISADNLNKIENGIESVDNAIEGHLVNVAPSVDEDYKVNFLKGKNILNETFVTGIGLDTSSGNTYSANNRASTNFVEVKPNTEYTISGCTLVVVCCYSSSQSFLGYVTTTTFTTLNDTKFIRICVNSNNSYSNTMLELGSTATTYEPYITPTINVDGDDIYSEPVVLWQNPNPTTSFVGQQITLNDSMANYNYIEIIFSNGSSNSYRYSTGKIEPNKLTSIYYFAGLENNSVLTLRYREITAMTNTTITFDNPYYKQLNNPSTRTDGGNQTIPIKILGYK